MIRTICFWRDGNKRYAVDITMLQQAAARAITSYSPFAKQQLCRHSVAEALSYTETLRIWCVRLCEETAEQCGKLACSETALARLTQLV
jgi:hypothetical protein